MVASVSCNFFWYLYDETYTKNKKKTGEIDRSSSVLLARETGMEWWERMNANATTTTTAVPERRVDSLLMVDFDGDVYGDHGGGN